MKSGDKMLEFTLLGDDEAEYTPSSFLGGKVLYFFYPKDNTSG